MNAEPEGKRLNNAIDHITLSVGGKSTQDESLHEIKKKSTLPPHQKKMNAKKSEVVEESKQNEARRRQKKKERYGESEPYSNK